MICRTPKSHKSPLPAATAFAFAAAGIAAFSTLQPFNPPALCSDASPARPNIVLILTDDQGYAELGVTGNPVIRTPNIDRLARQSLSLANFHTMPVCSPTRACLMTGRHYYRTGVTDTWMGRSLLDPSETTLAQMLAAAGYRTGIFGKWHLGDNYPRRAMDKGFHESLVLNGGGLGQPSDAPHPTDERGAYFNARMSRNGQWIATDGYVSDVITTAAMRFIEQNRGNPFFVYLPFNCPHTPHQVPDEYRRHYPPGSFDPAKYPSAGNPMPAKRDTTALARVYGMIENIDDNIGRLLAKLDELELARDTIVVFFSDNGSQQHNGYNGGLRGWKGTPFDGGIRQFCYIRWPARLQAGAQVDRISSIIDLAPTLLDLANADAPPATPSPAATTAPAANRVSNKASEATDSTPETAHRGDTAAPFDGRSLAPLMRGDAAARARAAAEWPDRALFFQWHRGDAPERHRAMSVRTQDWKLVQPLGGGEKWDGKTDFMLFDMTADPYEQHNLATQHPDRVARLKKSYDDWLDDILRSRDFDKPQRIIAGSPCENPVLLTRQDWRGPKASWGPGGHGHWELRVATTGRYDITIRFDPFKAAGEATIEYPGAVSLKKPFAAGDEQLIFENVALPASDGRLEVTVQTSLAIRGVKYVELARSE